jgi:hypothetical protein
MMSQKFKMIGKLSFFLGLQVKQIKEGTFICQSKYVNDLLKRFDMDNSKSIKTPMDTNAHLDLDEGAYFPDGILSWAQAREGRGVSPPPERIVLMMNLM